MKSGKVLSFLIVFLFAYYAEANPNASHATTWGALLRRAKNPAPVVVAPVSSSLTPAPEAKTSLLEQESQKSRLVGGEIWEFQMKPQTKIPRKDFFARYPEFHLNEDDEMDETRSEADNLGYVQSRHQQRYKGLEVIGGEFVLQEKDDAVNYGFGKIIHGLDLDATPALSETDALNSAKCATATQTCPWQDNPADYSITKKGLAVTSKDFKMTKESARLVWRFTVSRTNPTESEIYEIDAKTADVVNQYGNLIYDNPPPAVSGVNVPCTGQSRYDGMVSFVGLKDSLTNNYLLNCMASDLDSGCSANIETIDGRIPNPQGSSPNQISYFFNGGLDETFDDPEDDVGVSVHWGLEKTLEYYKKFNWRGFDGKGNVPIVAFLRPIYPPNAFFDPDDRTLAFSSQGDDVTRGPTVSLRTVGHEFTHGIIDQVTGWMVYAGESASLNEAFADIFGLLVQYFGSGKVVWKIGLMESLNGMWERSFDDPKSDVHNTNKAVPPHDPDTYGGLYYLDTTAPCAKDNDFCGAHINATIVDHWFYLLVMGGEGTNDLQQDYRVNGIGLDDAAQVAFRTMTTKFLKTSNFSDAYFGSIAAADEVFPESKDKAKHDAVIASVTNAWHAVGVGSDVDETVTPKDSETDVAPWPANLSWPIASQESAWQVQISTSSQFDKNQDPSLQTSDDITESAGPSSSAIPGLPHQSQTVPNPNNVIPAHSWTSFNLRPNTYYFWRVRAKTKAPPPRGDSMKGDVLQKGNLNWGEWSPTHYFKTGKVTTKLLSPVVGAKVYPWPPTAPGDKGAEFKWTPVSGATEFILLVTEPSESGECAEEKDPEYSPPIASTQIDKGTPLQGFTRMNQLTYSAGPMSFWSLALIGMRVTPKKYSADVTATYSHLLKVRKPYCWWVLPLGPEDPATHEKIAGNWSNNGKGQLIETSTPKGRLISPKAGATDISPWSIPIEWERTDGAVEYDLNLLKDYTKDAHGVIQGTSVFNQSGLKGTKTTVALDSAITGTDFLYALVTPKGPPPYNEYGFESDVRTFKVDPSKTKAELSTPFNGAWIDYKHVPKTGVFVPGDFFMWKQVEGATDYTLNFYPFLNGKCDTTAPLPGLSFPHANGVSPNNPAYIKFFPTPPQGIAGDHNYDRCWTVQAMKAMTGRVLSGIPSDPFLLGVGPDEPVLINPPNASNDVATSNVSFTWKSEWAPDGYDFYVTQVDTNKIIWGYTIPFASAAGTTKTGLGFDPKGGIQYVWSVIGKKKATPGIVTYNGYEAKQSDIATFKTKLACPTLGGTSLTFSPECSGNPCTECGYSKDVIWSPVTGANNYQVTVYAADYNKPSAVWVNKTMNFPSSRLSFSIDANTQADVPSIGNALYTITIKATNSCGNTGPTTTRQFYQSASVCN